MSYRSVPLETAKIPPGIPFIIANEAAERFSFYGMRTILVVFMVQYLHLMDGAGGREMSGNQAVEYYHQFTSWVYFTPLFGAVIADVFLGKYRTILWLSLVYCLGHAALACMGLFDNSAWWLMSGLALICIGSGGIKPCVSAHVGDQFGSLNQHFISQVYNGFYFSINFGAFFSTLLTPWLLVHYGPHWAFGVPGVLMAIATFLFWLGRHRFIHIPPAGKRFFKEMASREGLLAMAKLVPLFAFIAVFWSLYDQTGSSWVLQAEQMDLKFCGISWLESQVQAINPILILIYIPIFAFAIYPLLQRLFPLTPLRKMSIGLILMCAAFCLITLIQTWIDAGQRPSIGWQFVAFFIITASEVMVVIVGLEFAYTQAPRAMKSMVMALFWLSVWGGNQFTAQVNQAISIPSAAATQFAQATARLPEDWRKSPRSIMLPGYDGVTGTADDFLARCAEGALDAVEIPGKSTFMQAAERIEALSSESFPSREKGQRALADFQDLWGNSLNYEVLDSTHVRISSHGPDHLEKTQWDLGLIIEKVSASSTDDAGGWLSRRKSKPAVGGFSRVEFSGGQSRLEGACYFGFFTVLVAVATLLFFAFACFYRPKAYLHDTV
jgi:proton-dependent oligopeptide transporter, POT family